MASQLAGGKDGLEVGAQKTCRDNRLGLRIAVPAQPMRVRAADHFRKSVTAAIEIDGGGFTGIASQNADGGVMRQLIASANHCIRHFAPAEFLVEILIRRVGNFPPA